MVKNIKKDSYKILILVLLLGFIFLSVGVFDIDLYLFNWLEDGIYNLLAPFFNIVEGTITGVDNFFTALFSAQELIEENQMLRNRVAELSAGSEMMEEIRKENERLRQMLNHRDNIPDNPEILTGSVVGYSPATWQRKVMINIGRNEGLENDMPAVDYNGYLLGRVKEAGMSSSRIIMLPDPEFVVGGQVASEDSRALGLVSGLPETDDRVVMENIPWDAEIAEGDRIVTSGVSDKYPPGLPIGEVKEVESDKHGLSQIAYIKIPNRQRSIEEIMIIEDW